MLERVLSFLLLFSGIVSVEAYCQNNDDNEFFFIKDAKFISPDFIKLEFNSDLYDGDTFTVKYFGENKSFKMFKNHDLIEVMDPIFSSLSISPHNIELEEYYKNGGPVLGALKCQALHFYIVGHKYAKDGNIEFCEKSAPRLRLFGAAEDSNDEYIIVYDGKYSDELRPNGFWEELSDDEW